MSYPKIFTHFSNPNASVVVANADQEAELPDEYRPAEASSIDIRLSPEYDQLKAGREQLEQDRANLIAGYTADKANLQAARERLNEEIAEWERIKAGETPDTPEAMALVKRGRPAKE